MALYTKLYCIYLCVIKFVEDIFQLLSVVQFADLVKLQTCIQPTGPGGRGQGHGRGRAKLPNQLLTLRETVKYVEEAHKRSEKKEKVKKKNESFMKQAVADKKWALKKKKWIVAACFGAFSV